MAKQKDKSGVTSATLPDGSVVRGPKEVIDRLTSGKTGGAGRAVQKTGKPGVITTEKTTEAAPKRPTRKSTK